MTRHDTNERHRSRAKASSRAYLYLLILVLTGIGGFLYWRNQAPMLPSPTTSSPPAVGVKTESPSPESPAVIELPALTLNEEPPALEPAKDSDQSGSGMGGTGSPASANPQDLIKELNGFYAHLDRQAYMQDFGLQEPSKVHFSRLLQKLVDNPPVVIRETDDILTLLKNTAHFYRILDQDNIVVLKGILDRDRESLEPMLKTFYTLTYHPEYLQNEYSLTLPLDSLRDYASFFLNTIGGKLYLFRRDSASRMTISYYAILVLDRANLEGNNPYGIDIRPAIDSLIEEMENTGNNLKFRSEYLDQLYDLKVKYN